MSWLDGSRSAMHELGVAVCPPAVLQELTRCLQLLAAETGAPPPQAPSNPLEMAMPGGGQDTLRGARPGVHIHRRVFAAGLPHGWPWPCVQCTCCDAV